MKRKSEKSRYKGIIFILIVVLIVAIVSVYSPQPIYNSLDYVKADKIVVEGNTIVIGNGCKGIIATTTAERAKSIQLGLDGIIEERPDMHDTAVEIFKSYNITIEKVLLQRKDDKYYYSDILLTDGLKNLKLDMVPSDAIALALRAKADILINSTLLQEVGNNIC